MPHTLTLTRPLAFFDLETTGTSVFSDRIIEIAIIKLLPGGGEKVFSSRVNPEIPIPSASSAVHGITDKDVALEPTFKALAPKVRDFLRGCDVSGYNVRRFDLPLLKREFERLNVVFDTSDMHVVDVQTIFHMREPRDLSAAYRYYCGKDLIDAHAAITDVRATVEVFQAQLRRYDDLPGSILELEAEIHPRNPQWVDEDGKLIWENREVVMMFGKYRGAGLREVLGKDPRYLEWVLTGDFPQSTKNVIREAMAGRFPAPSAEI